MRISLARVLLLADIIVIDSDLTSLDKATRKHVAKNLQ